MYGDIEEVDFNQQRDGYVYVRGRDRLVDIADELQVDRTLLELYVLENTNCRKLAQANGRLTMMIDFTLVPMAELEQIADIPSWVAIPHGLFVDYIDPRDIGRKLAAMFAGSPSSPPNARIIDGEASPHAFLFAQNDINIVDPIFEMNGYFIVVERGALYQWKFAELISSTVQPKHSAYKSSHVDIVPFELSVMEYRKLLQNRDNLPAAINRAFSRVVAERKNILERLNEVHIDLKRKNLESNSPSVITQPPPRLGRFDSLDSTDGTLRIRTDMAPVYFGAAVQHIERARVITASPAVPDDVMGQTIPAIILAYLCLDAHVNQLGHVVGVSDWTKILRDRKTSLESKIGRLFTSQNRKNLLNKRPDLNRSLQEYVLLRNSLIHFDHEPWKVTIVGEDSMSELYGKVNLEESLRLVAFAVKLVTLINSELGFQVPRWLTKQTGWLENANLDFL